MGTTSVAQPRSADLGKPQRQYVVEPRELPVPMPTHEDPPKRRDPVEKPELEPAGA